FLALDRDQVERLDLGQSRLRCALRKNEGIQRKLHSGILQFIRRHPPLENGFPDRSEPLAFELLRKKPHPHCGRLRLITRHGRRKLLLSPSLRLNRRGIFLKGLQVLEARESCEFERTARGAIRRIRCGEATGQDQKNNCAKPELTVSAHM